MESHKNHDVDFLARFTKGLLHGGRPAVSPSVTSPKNVISDTTNTAASMPRIVVTETQPGPRTNATSTQVKKENVAPARAESESSKITQPPQGVPTLLKTPELTPSRPLIAPTASDGPSLRGTPEQLAAARELAASIGSGGRRSPRGRLVSKAPGSSSSSSTAGLPSMSTNTAGLSAPVFAATSARAREALPLPRGPVGAAASGDPTANAWQTFAANTRVSTKAPISGTRTAPSISTAAMVTAATRSPLAEWDALAKDGNAPISATASSPSERENLELAVKRHKEQEERQETERQERLKAKPAASSTSPRVPPHLRAKGVMKAEASTSIATASVPTAPAKATTADGLTTNGTTTNGTTTISTSALTQSATSPAKAPTATLFKLAPTDVKITPLLGKVAATACEPVKPSHTMQQSLIERDAKKAGHEQTENEHLERVITDSEAARKAIEERERAWERAFNEKKAREKAEQAERRAEKDADGENQLKRQEHEAEAREGAHEPERTGEAAEKELEEGMKEDPAQEQIARLKQRFEAFKQEQADRIDALNRDVCDMARTLQVLSDKEERRKFLGTDDAKVPFMVTVIYPSNMKKSVQVHRELSVADFIRRARIKGDLEATSSQNPRIVVRGKQAGHALLLGELGVAKDDEVTFTFDVHAKDEL